MAGAREWIEWLLGRVWFRAAFAALLVAMHVLDTRAMANERFHEPFDKAPKAEPVFHDMLRDTHVDNAKRLAVSRWDGEHYIALALRGYHACPVGPMTEADIRSWDGRCTLTFVPGYSMIGRALVRVHQMPMDYALFFISLLATFLTFLFWTGRTMTARFGYATTWIALIALNAHPSSCYLVYVGTEGCALFFTFAAYLSFAKKRFALGAILAGARARYASAASRRRSRFQSRCSSRRGEPGRAARSHGSVARCAFRSRHGESSRRWASSGRASTTRSSTSARMRLFTTTTRACTRFSIPSPRGSCTRSTAPCTTACGSSGSCSGSCSRIASRSRACRPRSDSSFTRSSCSCSASPSTDR